MDAIEEPLRFELLANADHYYIEQWLRDDKNSNIAKDGNCLKIPYNGNVSQQSELITFTFLIRQAERFLEDINFWNTNSIPNSKDGGILIFEKNGKLGAKVVRGNDRPELPCYRADLLARGFAEIAMARPYN